MTYACAFCGEENDTFVDPCGGARQVYTEDCAVCCRPNLITVTLDADGDAQLEVTQEYEARDERKNGVKTLLPWLVAVAFFMESLDTTILNTAVPSIAAALHVAPLSMKVALTSYTLSLAVFIPVSGWMADRYGTRRVFASAIGIFSLGSFLCGIAGSIHMLVAARILQGCGGAMMVPVGRLTLVRTFERGELVRALSFVSIPALVGPLLGPLAGGLIVGYLHWSLIFFVNVPVGLLGFYLVHRYLPDYRTDEPAPLDVTGVVLFGVG